MQYQVKMFQRTESLIAEFNALNDAKLFIEAKLNADALYKVNIIYRLYDMMEMVEEFNPGSIRAEDSASSSTKAGSSQSFSPTPFNTAPRPGGLPHGWVKDAKKDGKEEDKK